MAYVDFDGAHVLDAAEKLGPNQEVDDAFLRRHCPKVTAAMDRVTTWLRTSTTRRRPPRKTVTRHRVEDRTQQLDRSTLAS